MGKETALKPAPLTTPYNRALHGFAVFTAAVTFLLIVAGALVTSNQAGLSVPDWPTSFGSLYKIPHMVGGVKFEHSHRMIAEFVGLLTIILAVWTWKADRRPWMKKLGIAALGTVIAQGILGGLTVLMFLPAIVSTLHALVGQTFFCIAVAVAFFSGRQFTQEIPRITVDHARPSLIHLTLCSIAVVYLQLFFGGMFRHSKPISGSVFNVGMSWWPHVLNATLVAIILTWTAVRALTHYSQLDAIRKPAVMLLGLTITQLCLGFLAFVTRVDWGRDALQPETGMVVSTVAHTAMGALVLANAVYLALEAWRHVAVAQPEALRTAERKAIVA